MNRELILGALFHDLGKVVYRAGEGSGDHGKRGCDFLKTLFPETDERFKYKDFLDCIAYHHERKLPPDLSSDSLAYIVCHADSLAAGSDRRKLDIEGEEDQNYGRFNIDQPLASVFNKFTLGGKKSPTDQYHNLIIPDKEAKIDFPSNRERINTNRYRTVYNELRTGFLNFDLYNDSVDSFLGFLELVLSTVPSSTDASEVSDISLFQHQKLTAALATCMYLYAKENNISDYKECFLEKKEKFNQEKAFALVGGDISGIQKFIYTTSSSGALKMLRGRSFYLEILTERIVDELLEEFGISRANLIYSGGGRFYIILPNLKDLKKRIDDFQEKADNWFIDKFAANLYVAIEYVEASALDLGYLCKNSKGNGLGTLFRSVSTKISQKKLQRYSKENLEKLFSVKKNHLSDGRECSVCGRSDVRIEVHEVLGKNACGMCSALFHLGGRIIGIKEGAVVEITTEKEAVSDNCIEIFSTSKDKAYLSINLKEHNRKILKTYSINKKNIAENYSTNLWVGVYEPYREEKTPDFEWLSKQSEGIRRLGVLRADVDDLGQAFVSGFKDKKNGDIDSTYNTISRTTMLSESLSVFFKKHINAVCAGRSGIERFYVDNEKSIQNPKVVVVYSGGDDVFLVGAWDELLNVAVDLRNAFKKYTQGKMTISAGLGIFHHSFPITQMAKITGILESRAKEYNGGIKDSISLFGVYREVQPKREVFEIDHTYRWDAFIGKVYGEKLESLKRWFVLDDKRTYWDDDKIAVGRGFVYRLLTFYKEAANGDKGINLARLAYILARREPAKRENEQKLKVFNEMKSKMYNWAQNQKDSRQLVTALTLWIYLNRE